MDEYTAAYTAARIAAAEQLADAVEDFVFTTEKDIDRLRAAWQAYVEAADGRRAE